MGSSRVYSSGLLGLTANLVTVEVDISPGLPRFQIVGLPDAAVSESRERVRAAIKYCGLPFPRPHVTVNLAPADLKKQGPSYDFPIALAILDAQGAITTTHTWRKFVFLGELALDGTLRPVHGVLLAARMAKHAGLAAIAVPHENAREAALVDDIIVYAVKSLGDFVTQLENQTLKAFVSEKESVPKTISLENMSYVRGQEHAKRALEIAAAGGHNVLMVGPPGSGKTLLARAMPTILPELTLEERLEVTAIHSVAGALNYATELVTERPFRSPHHSSSGAALVGGGTWPRPGEISLAHRGVLFLDEFPEFSRSVLENLRQPLEDGVVSVSRAAASYDFPARFMLLAAMNPCPCGFLTDPGQPCVCTPGQIIKYQQKISGPLLDRIDLGVDVPRISFEKLIESTPNESSQQIQSRVQAARDRQSRRYADSGVKTNSELRPSLLRDHCRLDSPSLSLMKQAVERLRLSARAYSRVLKVARTIADLAGAPNISTLHLAESIQYRPRTST